MLYHLNVARNCCKMLEFMQFCNYTIPKNATILAIGYVPTSAKPERVGLGWCIIRQNTQNK